MPLPMPSRFLMHPIYGPAAGGRPQEAELAERAGGVRAIQWSEPDAASYDARTRARSTEDSRPTYLDHENPSIDSIEPSLSASALADNMDRWKTRFDAIRAVRNDIPLSIYGQFGAFLPFQRNYIRPGDDRFKAWVDHTVDVLIPAFRDRIDFMASGSYWYRSSAATLPEYLDSIYGKSLIARVWKEEAGIPVYWFLSRQIEGRTDERDLTRNETDAVISLAEELQVDGLIAWGGRYDGTSNNNFDYDGADLCIDRLAAWSRGNFPPSVIR